MATYTSGKKKKKKKKFHYKIKTQTLYLYLNLLCGDTSPIFLLPNMRHTNGIIILA